MGFGYNFLFCRRKIKVTTLPHTYFLLKIDFASLRVFRLSNPIGRAKQNHLSVIVLRGRWDTWSPLFSSSSLRKSRDPDSTILVTTKITSVFQIPTQVNTFTCFVRAEK
jgi:hypothetical protein